jgi:hypothetical protein
MPQSAPRLLAVLTPIVLLAACGSTRQTSTARLLDHRLQTQLAADIAANRVALQQLPNGARVTFLVTAPTPGGLASSLPDEGSNRSSVIEALLDPTLIRVAVDDTAPVTADQRAAQIASIRQYFQDNALGSVLLPDSQPQILPPGPAGVALTISVVCPDRNDGAGYGTGKDKPGCF